MNEPYRVQRTDETIDVLPRYNVAFIRHNSGLSQEQSGGPAPDSEPDSIDPFLRSAVQSFESDTLLKLFRHAFAVEYSGRELMRAPERAILLPGLDCELTAFTCDGEDISEDAYKSESHSPTGCLILTPLPMWSFGSADSLIRLAFNAGLESQKAISAHIQDLLAVRIRYNIYGSGGDLLRYNDERRRYQVGVKIYR